uniref:Uncharacterized protein n=1 Tax=Romanomermis culicivorax TaxID=13658 RepID=A0A915K272_ROMCU
MKMDIAFVKNTLGSSSKLIRDNAVETLCEFIRLSKFDDPKAREFENLIVGILANGHENQELGWESYNGCLLALDCFVSCDLSLYAKENPLNLLIESRCLRFCHHEESRLKTTLGEFLHTMTFKHGASVYKFCANELLPSIVNLVESSKVQPLNDKIISPTKVKNFASLESYV